MRQALAAIVLVLSAMGMLPAGESSPTPQLSAQKDDWAEWTLHIHDSHILPEISTTLSRKNAQTIGSRLPRQFSFRLQVLSATDETLELKMHIGSAGMTIQSQTLTWKRSETPVARLTAKFGTISTSSQTVTIAEKKWAATEHLLQHMDKQNRVNIRLLTAEAFPFRLLSCITDDVRITLIGQGTGSAPPFPIRTAPEKKAPPPKTQPETAP